MAMLAEPSFLDRLKSIYPQTTPNSGKYKLESVICFITVSDQQWFSIANPWYIIAAVGFCAGNRPEAVPDIFQHALKELELSGDDGNNTVAKQRLLARRFREALFKAGLTCGYARVRSSVTCALAHLIHQPCPRQSTHLLPCMVSPLRNFAIPVLWGVLWIILPVLFKFYISFTFQTHGHNHWRIQ